MYTANALTSFATHTELTKKVIPSQSFRFIPDLIRNLEKAGVETGWRSSAKRNKGQSRPQSLIKDATKVVDGMHNQEIAGAIPAPATQSKNKIKNPAASRGV